MSIDPAILRAMAEAGASMEVILAAVEAAHARDNERLVEKRRKDAERQRKSRANREQSQNVTVTSRDNADTPPLSPPLSPTPPNSPPISPRSDDKSSGVAAPELGDNVIVLADPRADLFSRGLKIMAGLTGKPEGQLRGLLGKWLKAESDNAVKVLRVIEDAARNRVAEPVAWIEAALKQKPQAKRQETFSERARRLNAEWV